MRQGVLLAGESVVVPRARRTDGPLERARGLLARPPLEAGEALLIEPCAGIHTWAMAYPIDAAFFSRDGKVLKIAAHLTPWRFSACPGARGVIELKAGEAARLGMAVGQQVKWKGLHDET